MKPVLTHHEWPACLAAIIILVTGGDCSTCSIPPVLAGETATLTCALPEERPQNFQLEIKRDVGNNKPDEIMDCSFGAIERCRLYNKTTFRFNQTTMLRQNEIEIQVLRVSRQDEGNYTCNVLQGSSHTCNFSLEPDCRLCPKPDSPLSARSSSPGLITAVGVLSGLLVLGVVLGVVAAGIYRCRQQQRKSKRKRVSEENEELLNTQRQEKADLKVGQDKLQKDKADLEAGQKKLQNEKEVLNTEQEKLQKGKEELNTEQEKLRKGKEELNTEQDKLQKGKEELQKERVDFQKEKDRTTEEKN